MASRKKSSKEAKFQPSGEVRRIISLGGGEWAYVLDPLGKRHHVRRDSDRFRELVEELDEKMDGKGSKELARLGW